MQESGCFREIPKLWVSKWCHFCMGFWGETSSFSERMSHFTEKNQGRDFKFLGFRLWGKVLIGPFFLHGWILLAFFFPTSNFWWFFSQGGFWQGEELLALEDRTVTFGETGGTWTSPQTWSDVGRASWLILRS